jgi:hypothetical protein
MMSAGSQMLETPAGLIPTAIRSTAKNATSKKVTLVEQPP